MITIEEFIVLLAFLSVVIGVLGILQTYYLLKQDNRRRKFEDEL